MMLLFFEKDIKVCQWLHLKVHMAIAYYINIVNIGISNAGKISVRDWKEGDKV